MILRVSKMKYEVDFLKINSAITDKHSGDSV